MKIELLKIEMEKLNYHEKYIEACCNYATNLKNQNLPIIFDLKHLSLLLGMSHSTLYNMLQIKNNLYKKSMIPKKNGGSRELTIPSKNLRIIQRWILENILYKLSTSINATGFIQNKSILDNAKPHVGKKCLINLDLKDFFPNIKFNSVYSLFNKIGYSKHISMILANLCTYNGVLPQGAPTSPCISNLLCKRLDKRLSTFSNNNNFTYTRYADDMSFSGEKKILKYLPLIKKIVESEGFKFNSKKERILFGHNQQSVTGLIINEKISVPKKQNVI